MQGELAPGGAFLWVDGLPEPRRSETYARLQRGEVVSARLQTADPSGRFVHARRSDSSLGGDGFHSGSFAGAGARGGSGLRPPRRILQAGSGAIENGRAHGRRFKVHYRLRKKKIITIILDTDYDVHRHVLDAAHAYSNSYSTRIAQVENAGEPDEHELPPGKDGGYLVAAEFLLAVFRYRPRRVRAVRSHFADARYSRRTELAGRIVCRERSERIARIHAAIHARRGFARGRCALRNRTRSIVATGG